MKRIYNFDPTTFKFSYSLDKIDDITTANFIDAIDLACNKLKDTIKNNNCNTIALFLSGVDSELIARSLHLHRIPTEYYFLHILKVNKSDLILVRKIAERYNTKLNVITIEFSELLNNISVENFNIHKVCFPTYASVPYLIKHIPDDYYIVIGEGDIEKTNDKKYSKLFNKKITNYDPNYLYIPMHLSEISYTLSIDYYKKKGEGNFFSTDFNLWYHILSSTELISNGKYHYDPKTNFLQTIKDRLNLLSPIKTLNFENQFYWKLLFDQLYNYGTSIPNWSNEIGDIAKIHKDYLK